MSIYSQESELLPRLICNNPSKNVKVIQEIETSFSLCDSFDFSVAFISDSGISSIKQSLINARDKKKIGRIVTSTYLGFNSPKTFRELISLFKDSSIEVRIYQKDGFHPKGYIFKSKDDYKIIIGSSNITQNALSVNQEWNICLTSFANSEIVERINDEFEDQWNESIPITDKWIDEYEKTYIPPTPNSFLYNTEELEPNKMQTDALVSLHEMRDAGKDKALLISATGTGKTFLSAFDVKQFDAKRALFVVHRETIARKALESFKHIIKGKTMGMFTGVEKHDECDYLFATINTIGKKEYLERFVRDEFDYIIIDEVHRAGANMYKKLLSYFKPKFLLGMSATPERTDRPETIYELFDYNIAYEIRLKQAMEYDLLCPFHYFGISDLIVDGEYIDDHTELNHLVQSERVKHIINAIETYGHSGNKPHGLIFVSRAEEAYELSELFNERTNYKTRALTGNDSDEERRKAIALLETNDTSGEYLDYIFTVDIFNEGIDIPCVNQVVMLRATKSAIIFVQQLGRGLRKDTNKEYVNVIDIIGNYENNFMIPIALSGSTSYNKDELRKFIYDGNLTLPGCSTVSFDEITKTRIYESIDKAKLNSIQTIKDAYQKLKARLANTIPSLMDFDKYSSIDPLIIINKCGSYYNFLERYEKDYLIRLNNTEKRYLQYISTRFASGKRIQELELIKQIINTQSNVFEHLKDVLRKEYEIEYDESATRTIVNELTGNFNVGSGDKYEDVILIRENGEDYSISLQFSQLLNNEDFKGILCETIEFGISRFNSRYKERYMNTDLVLYQKYTYDDVYRLLNWEKAEVSLNVGGYKYDEYSNTFPVFINYDKTDAEETIKYEDKFVNRQYIDAISKHPRKLSSRDAEVIEKAKENGTKIHMFVRKNKEDDIKEFYYLGLVDKYDEFKPFVMPNGQDVFRIPYKFETQVREDIYSYICD
ncbi:MAG: DEAD/DEAH box helicase [Erysipelotrichaceae bacterium]|nr:DEAD/DEAH box helicase [Erysipelotrichaceae bacterium]